MDKSRTPEISAENRPVSPAASPDASTSAAAPCSASDTAVCTAGSPISNAADKAVNAGKVVKVHKCPICGKLTDNAKYRPFVPNAAPILTSVPGLPKDMLLKAKRRLTRKKGNNIPLLFIAPLLYFAVWLPNCPAASRSGLNLYPQQLNQPARLIWRYQSTAQFGKILGQGYSPDFRICQIRTRKICFKAVRPG